jgi:hypothetical protein
MKKSSRSNDTDPGPRLHTVNQYLEKNFPDFLCRGPFPRWKRRLLPLRPASASTFASSIEHRRFKSDKISRGFHRAQQARPQGRSSDPQVRHILVSGPLEEIVDEPKARPTGAQAPVAGRAELPRRPLRVMGTIPRF